MLAEKKRLGDLEQVPVAPAACGLVSGSGSDGQSGADSRGTDTGTVTLALAQ